MNPKEIRELIEFLVEQDIAEFELERGDFKIRVKRPQAVVAAYSAAPVAIPVAAPAAAHAPALAVAEPVLDTDAGLDAIKSPIVGTFYEAASPGAPAFVKEGDTVVVGQVLCIVEAMKLMNEIESEAAGQIVKVLVANGQPVEYGQPLFRIRSK